MRSNARPVSLSCSIQRWTNAYPAPTWISFPLEATTQYLSSFPVVPWACFALLQFRLLASPTTLSDTKLRPGERKERC
jgi:hypothetical protein